MDLKVPEVGTDMEDSCDSSSDILKPDYSEAGNYDSQAESGSESQADFAEIGMRNALSSGLTMKEYEEQLEKLTAENFNLKLRVYFVEERLSKVTGISDKEDLIKKNIQLKVTCESQLKELERKQELLFEASKAFELLQKEHAEEMEKLLKEKGKEIADLEEKVGRLEAAHGEFKSKFPNMENFDAEFKTFEEYEKQINDLEANLREEEDRYKELENVLKDNQLELESFQLKSQRMESELDQRMRRIEELVDELEQKERDLASSNFRIRKLEDESKSKQREDEIMKERIEEKNKTIDSLKNSLASRDETIEVLENRIAKERSSSQTLQSKVDSLSFQNARLKEELEILQSRLRRTVESLSPRAKGRPAEEDPYKPKYEEAVRALDEQEERNSKRIKELEEKLMEKVAEAEDYQELFEKHKKLEDDHRKACTALKNFIKRSGEEKKEREALNQMLTAHEEVIADLKAQLDHYRNDALARLALEDKLSVKATANSERMNGCAAADKDSGTCESKKLRGPGPRSEEKEKASEETELCTEKKLNKNSCSVGSNPFNSFDQILNMEAKTKNTETELLNGESNVRKNNKSSVSGETCEEDLRKEKLEKDLVALATSVRHFAVPSEGEPNEIKTFVEKKTFEPCAGRDFWECDRSINPASLSGCSNTKRNTWGTGIVWKEAAEICTLLSSRLEELAEFLDNLFSTSKLLGEVGSEKSEEVKRTMEKTLELSRHLSSSFAEEKSREFSTSGCYPEDMSFVDAFLLKDTSAILNPRDKVISEQTLMIDRLREQLKFLSQEIKLRDIELFRYQGDWSLCPGDDSTKRSFGEGGIENLSWSVCQDVSDFESVEDSEIKEAKPSEEGKESFENSVSKSRKRYPTNTKEKRNSRETSESEGWSEPDRSVSLARMGRLEDPALNSSLKNPLYGDSSGSSEETLDDGPKNPGKKSRSTESEMRRLQSKIKSLDEVNENLRSEIVLLKEEKTRLNSECAAKIQKNEEASLVEKLKKTMNRLEECSLTCRQTEEKLARALERASTSAMQLSKAEDTIALLESQITELKGEINSKTIDVEKKARRIAELESKIEELTIESELKIIEAVKQKEAAERKTLEVECKLKDAENASKELESRVNEIEKKIDETKKFKRETVLHFKEAEKHVDTAEKMMEEAERIKVDAERKSKDFQNFIDLMRKEVEEKMKEAEKRIRKCEKEKEELEKQVVKLKKKLLEAEKNKAEVETKVKEGKETIRCMEEKLKELEIAMDQCGEEAQRKIKEMQKKADAKVAELEIKIEEREWVRKTETERKMAEAEKLSKELEISLKRQLEDAEVKVKKAKESAEVAIDRVREEARRQESDLLQRIFQLEVEKKEECGRLRRQIEDAKLEASEFELELTKLTNEKIHLEEELKRMLDKESALVKDNREIKGRYETAIHDLENKLSRLTSNKSQLATRLEEIESTNIELVSRISAIRGKETTISELSYSSAAPPGTFFGNSEPERCFSPDSERTFARQLSAASDPGARTDELFSPPRRNMNSSPDLGIDSDPGRFSSLEAHQANSEGPGLIGYQELTDSKRLESENAELKRRLVRTRQALEETLSQLSAANQRKKQVERAICKQLHKTHHILKKARVNFEPPDEDPLE